MEFVDSLKESVREKKIKIRPEIRKEEKRIAGQENAGELQFLAARCLFMGGIAFLCGRAAAGAAELPCAAACMAAVMGREKANIYVLLPLLLGMFLFRSAEPLLVGEALAVFCIGAVFFVLRKKQISLAARALFSAVVLAGCKILCCYAAGQLYLYNAVAALRDIIFLLALTVVFRLFFDGLAVDAGDRSARAGTPKKESEPDKNGMAGSVPGNTPEGKLHRVWENRLLRADGVWTACAAVIWMIAAAGAAACLSGLGSGEAGSSAADGYEINIFGLVLHWSGFADTSLLNVAGFLAVLAAGQKRGMLEGCLAGSVAGVMAFLLGEGSPVLVGIFGFCGVVAGCFRRSRPIVTALVFTAAALLFSLTKGYPDLYVSVYEPLIAALIFTLLSLVPRSVKERVLEWFPAVRPVCCEGIWNEKRRAKKTLTGYRDAFERLALCCGAPSYRNPAKDVLALELQGMVQVLDGLLKELEGEGKPNEFRKPHYQIQMGASGYAREKDISGDSYLWEHVGKGEYLMALSDGMGQGSRAAQESGLTVHTLRDLLKAGFDAEVALRIVNSLLLLKSTDEIFSTVDMGMLNLYTGKFRLYKIGAAATFIKRGDQVKVIKVAALPMGLVERISVNSVEFRVRRGDSIIIVSDGITDAGAEGSENLEWLESAIRGIRSKDPQTMADLILNRAVERRGVREKDDMTVMVASVS